MTVKTHRVNELRVFTNITLPSSLARFDNQILGLLDCGGLITVNKNSETFHSVTQCHLLNTHPTRRRDNLTGEIRITVVAVQA
jgi:hypothetical protein